jgi:hypothetical protein
LASLIERDRRSFFVNRAASTTKKPFLYLIFGKQRALLDDTGVVASTAAQFTAPHGKPARVALRDFTIYPREPRP